MVNPKRIRILQVTANLGIGGLERVVVNLCKQISRDRFNVSVCCLKFKGDFAQELEEAGIPVYLLPQISNGPDYTAFTRLRKLMRGISPHLVHTHNTNSFVDSTLASLMARVPVRINTDHARNFPGRLTDLMLDAICALFADKFIAVSPETKRNLMRYEKIPARKIDIINNGIDGSAYDISIDIESKKKELGLSKFEHIIGLGVRLTPQKGIIHLINAAPLILKNFPKTAFVIAGKGDLLESLRRQANNIGVGEHFFFIGPRLDLAEILQIFDIYVLPSEWEGLPLALLEAMASGRSIIATNVGGIPRAIEHDKTGILVQPKDPESLAHWICYLLNNPQLRQSLGEKAQKRFYRDFSVERMAREYEKLYENVLRNKWIL